MTVRGPRKVRVDLGWEVQKLSLHLAQSLAGPAKASDCPRDMGRGRGQVRWRRVVVSVCCSWP